MHTILAVLLAALVQAPTPAQTSSISGNVSIAGKPAANTAVMLTSRGDDYRSKSVARTTTDKDGDFHFDNLAGGNYRILPNAPGFVVNGKKNDWDPGMSVTLGEGETLGNVGVTLERGGVVTGRLMDSDGKPMIGESVRMIPIDSDGKRVDSNSWGSNTQTDDRGIYRAFGLQPGRYLVAAGQDRRAGSYGMGSARKRFPLTYHPSSQEESRAVAVDVVSNGEVTGIDIVFGKLETNFSVSGVVLDEKGEPVSKMSIGYGPMVNGKATGGFGYSNRSGDSGEFQLSGLPPGNYAAMVLGGEDRSLYAAPAPFDVVDHDVTGLVIKMKRGMSVTGTLQIEGSASTDSSTFQQLSIALSVPDDADTDTKVSQGWGKTSRIEPGGSFAIRGLAPGRYVFSVFGQTGEARKGLMIVRIERNGAVVDGAMELSGSDDQTGFVVTVAHGNGSIRGSAVVTGGKLSTNRLGLRHRRADGKSNAGWGEIDDRGKFLIEGLIPGEYVLWLDGYTGDEPGQAKVHHGKEQRVTVGDSAASDVTLTLDLEKDPVEENPW